MRAIETHYKGYRFRSRLEARWAVFFDALSYQWEYEPQGFVLSNGQCYLPDFRIFGTDNNGDDFNFYVEVKAAGSGLGVDKFDRFLVELLDEGVGLRDAILLEGPPNQEKMYRGTMTEITGDYYSMCDGYRGRPSWWSNLEEAERFAGQGVDSGIACPFAIALSARFEHGEHPWGFIQSHIDKRKRLN